MPRTHPYTAEEIIDVYIVHREATTSIDSGECALDWQFRISAGRLSYKLEPANLMEELPILRLTLGLTSRDMFLVLWE